MSAGQRYDVAVVGAGIAGLAASVLLRQAGFTVVCLDAHPHPHRKVGESLDWSSPGLLTLLGIRRESLLSGEIATPKAQIAVHEIDRAPWAAGPPPQVRRAPLRFETLTLHVDRTALDERVYGQALRAGTVFVWERVSRVEWTGERVTACATDAGWRVEARWYLDASGTARLFAHAMDIPVRAYGRRKVCLWTYFDTPPLAHGTTFFVDNDDAYLSWVWDIPISPRQTSVGFVLPADVMRDHTRRGRSPATVLLDELRRHRRFDALLARPPAQAIERTSFQAYVTTRVCGANWMMAGEAASMPDPLTGNGVTSGIRHARHASEAITSAGGRDAFTARQRRDYHRHVFRLGRAFNAHIEHAIYRPEIRQALGLKTATYVYTLFAFFTNALHARVDPRGRMAMAVFALVFAMARAWIAGWRLLARVVSRGRRARRRPPPQARAPARPVLPGADAGADAAAPE